MVLELATFGGGPLHAGRLDAGPTSGLTEAARMPVAWASSAAWCPELMDRNGGGLADPRGFGAYLRAIEAGGRIVGVCCVCRKASDEAAGYARLERWYRAGLEALRRQARKVESVYEQERFDGVASIGKGKKGIGKGGDEAGEAREFNGKRLDAGGDAPELEPVSPTAGEVEKGANVMKPVRKAAWKRQFLAIDKKKDGE